MSFPPQLEKYSIGVGDRFAQQTEAQLRACVLLAQNGVNVTPVWNKSHREHMIIGTTQASTRLAADSAVRALGWKGTYFVDADHVRLDTVDRFVADSDYFTLDVGDAIGHPIVDQIIEQFISGHPELLSPIELREAGKTLRAGHVELRGSIQKYLPAVIAAAAIYHRILELRPDGNFITEISMDETDEPQTALDLLVILAAAADQQIKLDTIAPKFTGRFNKGVEYVGAVNRFTTEFREDLSAIQFAAKHYELPSNLKLSVHSGSDKFSLYSPIRSALLHFNAGLHLKTSGTTWLQEVVGVAAADDKGCSLVKELYGEALSRIDELCAPYTSVIAIDRAALPPRSTVERWTAEQLVAAIEHDPENASYNPHIRQLLHVGYKIAAEMGDKFLNTLNEHRASTGARVTANLYERHLKPLFVGS